MDQKTGGWILLHKKIWESVAGTSAYSFTIWCWLLTHCDEQGNVRTGRRQISKETKIGAETVRYWTTRFLRDDYMMTTTSTTHQYTTYHICNWQKYQRKTTHPTTTSLRDHYALTTPNKEERIKNKEVLKTKQVSLTPRTIFLSLKNLSDFEKDFSTKNVQLEFEKAKDWLLSTGKVYKDYTAFFRGWLRRSDDKHVAFLDLSGKGKQ